MILKQRFIPGLAIYSYLLGDERTGTAAVIDPVRDIGPFLEIAKAEGLRIRHVLETHVHADFLSGAGEFKALLGSEVSIHASGLGGPEWTPPYADHVVKDGDVIHMGSIRLEAVHTPGHTPEHLSWALFDEDRSKDTPWLLFTGDFVFVGDVGRPDLLGEEARKVLAGQLYTSTFERLPAYPDFTEIFPGHGAGSLCGKAIGARNASTLGYERRFNASLQTRPEAEWIKTLLHDMPIAPPYFRRMKTVNAQGAPIIGPSLPGQRAWTPEEIHAQLCEDCLVIDMRSKEAFAGAHLPNSINLPLGDTMAPWAGWVLPYDRPILMVLEDPAQSASAATHLLRVGFDEIRGYLEGGVAAWANRGYATEYLETRSVHDLEKRLHGKASGAPFILDVRTESEWNGGHIASAHHIHGGLLQERIAEVPEDQEIAVVCGSGFRASIAASFLKRAGRKHVVNILGGMSAWKAAELPLSSDS